MLIEGLNEAFANYFGLTTFEALKLAKIHINELIPDISDNINLLLAQKKLDCISFKGVLQIPESFTNGDQSTYGFGGQEETSEDIGGNFESSKKMKATLKSLNNKSWNKLFKNVKKYAISYDVTVDGFQPYGMTEPLNIFIVNILEVSEMTKSSTSFFLSQKNITNSDHIQDLTKTKIIITKAPETKVEGKLLFSFVKYHIKI